MKSELEAFAQCLDPATSPRLRKAVADTVSLMGVDVDTIDTLVQKLDAGQLDHMIADKNVDAWTRNGIRRRRAKDATVAISAAFLSKEKIVRELGFGGYRDFLYQLFPGAQTSWLAVERSSCPHVLTFNYDQAFEMAFLSRFSDTSASSLYGQNVLNSGVDLPGIGFEPEAFSFLKLHGSVGMWVADFCGRPQYQQNNPETTTVADSLFFADPEAYPGQIRSEREPLLFFPSQKQFILSNESGFLFHQYGRVVWDRAEEVISNATEIHVIGYSFSGIDRGPILDLLGRAQDCRHLVIQSPDAENICNKLKLERRQWRDRIESVPSKF